METPEVQIPGVQTPGVQTPDVRIPDGPPSRRFGGAHSIQRPPNPPSLCICWDCSAGLTESQNGSPSRHHVVVMYCCLERTV